MRGVIVEGELWTRERAEAEPVRAFLELEGDTLHVRRAYGERAAVVSLELDDLEAALEALKAQANRRPLEPIPGQTALAVDEHDGDT